MSRRAAILAALALALGLAMPLAVESWLRGGHVTPEQSLSHARAVVRDGDHVHARPPAPASAPADHPSEGPTGLERAVEDGAALTTLTSPPISSLWQAVAAALLALVAPPAGRLGRRPRPVWPPGLLPAMPPPPPRSLAPARA